MSRTRLTARENDRTAVEDSIPYPGTVNQPDRKFKKRDQYDIDWETINHPYPDMRTEWRGDSRDEIGFGIPEGNPPTVASVKVAANKSVRLAVLLLGDKVGDETIEAQARDLMAMSQQAMDRTLERFAETQTLYAEDEDEAADKDDDESKEAGEMPPQFAENAKKIKDKAEAKKDDSKDESKKAEDEDAEDEESKEASEDDAKEDDAKDEESKEAAEEPVEAEDEDAEDEESKDASEEVTLDEGRKSGELDIELNSASADEAGVDPEADARLAAVLFDDEPAPVARKAAKPEKKTGIKKLGGQPRVASGNGSADISDIWNSAPDVSEVFG